MDSDGEALGERATVKEHECSGKVNEWTEEKR